MTQPSIPGLTVPSMLNEKEFQAQVIEAAHLAGFVVAHFHPLRTKYGWKTPAAADGAGFPDLVMYGRGKVMFRELKKDRNSYPSVDQKAWLEGLAANGGDAAIWRPRDMRDVVLPELGLRAL